MSETNYDELFDPTIDKNKLDEEWVAHPKKVEEINRLLAKSEKSKELVKFNLDVLEAELDKKGREILSKTSKITLSYEKKSV
jgi:hypothetical protein